MPKFEHSLMGDLVPIYRRLLRQDLGSKTAGPEEYKVIRSLQAKLVKANPESQSYTEDEIAYLDWLLERIEEPVIRSFGKQGFKFGGAKNPEWN